MSSLVTSLKSEITRVARKELKGDLQLLRKITTAHRSEIAALKRQVKVLASEIKAANSTIKSAVKQIPAAELVEKPNGIRFTAERFAALRKKLGLTQTEMAKVLGASSLSVHKWETGNVQPRAAQLEKIASVMKLGKKEVGLLLEE